MSLLAYYVKIFLRFLKAQRSRMKNGVIRKSFGKENPGKTVYIINRNDSRVGLFSYFIINLGQIAYAEKKGYVPVVDMMNYPNSYLSTEKEGNENAWEYYFKQPTSLSLQDAYQSEHVIISSFGPWVWPSDSAAFFSYRSLIMDKWRRYTKQYIRLSDEVIRQVDEAYARLFSPGERVLGIKCRGTDYLMLKPKGHAVQPEIADVIAKAHEVIVQYNIGKVYIATEDQAIEDRFKAEFGDRLVRSEQSRREYDGTRYISEMRSDRENDQYLNGLEYLVTILLLARCNCFLSGRNSGAVGVMLFTAGFEYDYIWNLGVYK